MNMPTPDGGGEPNFRRLLIVGAGGSGREVAWLAEQAWGSKVELTFVVDDVKYLQDEVNGIPVRTLVDPSNQGEDARFVVAVGDPGLRRKLSSAAISAGLQPTTVIHPRCEHSRWVTFGCGTIVCAGSIITTNVRIGEHVQINTGCTIAHDVMIGSFVTLGPGVHISGNVHINDNVYVGTGACIINGTSESPLTIGTGAVIAAGACVTKAVERSSLVAGVPAVRKK